MSTITNSNGVITSDDAFVMLDTHSVFGGDVGSSVSGTWSEGWTDNGTDVDVSSANGTSSPTAIALTFSNSDSSGDVGSSNESAVGEYTHNGGNNNSAINFTAGTYVSNAEGSDYNTYSSTTFDDSNWITGTEYWMGVSYPVNVGNGTSETLVTTVTGPPPVTTTLTDVSGTYSSHTYGPYGSTGLVPPTGTAVTAGFGTAIQLGYYEGGGVHNGSDNRGFDGGSGLASALGGQDVHGLEFTGAEEQAIAYNGTIGMDDFDGTYNSEDGAPLAWQTHPSTVGYVRGNQGSGSSAGTQGAAMDSGTRDGTPADELARLSNSGTEENPTSAQPAPTPRAEQAAGTPAASGASAAAANPGNVGNSNGANAAAGGGGAMASGMGGGGSGSGDMLQDIMSPNNGAWGNRPWGPGINPFTGNGTYNPFASGGSDANGGGQRNAQDHGTMGSGPSQGGPSPGIIQPTKQATPTQQQTTPAPVATLPGSQTPTSPTAAPQPPTIPPQPPSSELRELALDGIQMGLDLGGIVDPTPITDGASALISVGRGDWWGAGISVLGMAPYVGDLAKLGKLGKYGKSVTKIIELAKNNAKVAEMFRPMLWKIYNLIKKAPLDKLPASIAKPLRKMRDDIADFLLPASPTKKLQQWAQQGGYVDPKTNQWIKHNGTLAADHIYPKDLITQLPGFEKLTPKQQEFLLNYPGNFEPLPRDWNSSKLNRLADEWRRLLWGVKHRRGTSTRSGSGNRPSSNTRRTSSTFGRSSSGGVLEQCD